MRKSRKVAPVRAEERIVLQHHLHAIKGGDELVIVGSGGKVAPPPPDPNGGG